MVGAGHSGPALGGGAREARWILPSLLFSTTGGRKGFKRLSLWPGLEIVLGHSVERISQEAAEWEPTIEKDARRWAVLDSYYVPTRYPNSIPGNIPARVYTAEAAQGAVALAREVVSWVQAKMRSGSG